MTCEKGGGILGCYIQYQYSEPSSHCHRELSLMLAFLILVSSAANSSKQSDTN